MNKYFKERNFRRKDRDFLGKVKRKKKNPPENLAGFLFIHLLIGRLLPC